MTLRAKQVANKATAILGIVCIAGFAVLFLRASVLDTSDAYRLSLIAAILVVLTMETRVRMGLRLPRGRLFALHLCASVAAFLLLVMLAFSVRPWWARALAPALLMLSAGAGGMLLYRGIRAHAAPEGDAAARLT